METIVVSEPAVVTVVDTDALVENVVVSEAVVKAMVASKAEEEATIISEIVEEATFVRAYSAFRRYGEDCGGCRHYRGGPGSLRGYGGPRCHRVYGDDCDCFRSYGGLRVCGGDLVSKDVIMQEVVGTDTAVVKQSDFRCSSRGCGAFRVCGVHCGRHKCSGGFISVKVVVWYTDSPDVTEAVVDTVIISEAVVKARVMTDR